VKVDFKNMSLRDLTESIEKGVILVPEMIQRGFVWGNAKVFDLFESIFRSYPIGIIVLWEISDDLKQKIVQGEDVQIGFKPIVESSAQVNPKYFVVDGLQRLTSFILFKKREVKVLSRQKEYIKKTVSIYYNPDKDQVGPRKSDVGNPAILVQDILSDNLNRYKLSGEQLNNVYDFKYKILNYSVPVYVLSPDYDIVDIANIFDRINSRGTKVVLAQIITAYLAVKLGDVAIDLWNYVKDLEKQGLAMNITTPAKSLSYILAGTTQVKKLLDKIGEREIKKDEVNEAWKNLKRAYDMSFMLLNEHTGLTNTRILPSETPLTALSIILYKIDKERIKRDSDFNKALAYWFVLATYHRYYTGSTEVKLDGDIKAVDKVIEEGGKLNDIIKVLVNRLLEVVGSIEINEKRLEEATSREARTKFLIYVLLCINNAIDWYTVILFAQFSGRTYIYTTYFHGRENNRNK